MPYRCSTGHATSTEAVLRYTSLGTSDHQTRLVFDPYPQITQTNCTLELLLTSIGLSPNFVMFRDRSSGFEPCRYDSTHFHTLLLVVHCENLVSLRLRSAKA